MVMDDRTSLAALDYIPEMVFENRHSIPICFPIIRWPIEYEHLIDADSGN